MTNSVTHSPIVDDSAAGWQVKEPRGSIAPDTSQAEGGANASPAASTAPKSSAGDVGTALRNAFRATVDEDIPSEMLDLLRRLD